MHDQSDSVMYCLLLSRALTCLRFNFISDVYIPYISASFHSRFLGGVQNPLLNHLCTNSSTNEVLKHGLNFRKSLKKAKKVELTAF